MRYPPPATETVTYKCEGCGVRHPATARWCHPDYPRAVWTVCSPACFLTAYANEKRQLTRKRSADRPHAAGPLFT